MRSQPGERQFQGLLGSGDEDPSIVLNFVGGGGCYTENLKKERYYFRKRKKVGF
jgi:hypothetical protein